MLPGERLAAAILLAVLVAGPIGSVPAPAMTTVDLEARAAGAGWSPAAPPVTIAYPALMDAFIEGNNPDRNYGGSDLLAVGGDPANATARRGLVHFAVTGIPSTATIVNATFRAYSIQGTAGQTVNVHRVRANWSEGTGRQYGFRQLLTVTESAGVPRLREPIEFQFNVPVPLSTAVLADFRVYDDAGQEVPSQVYDAQYDPGGNVTRVRLVFGATVGAFASRQYSLYYGNSVPVVPAFRTRTFGVTEKWTAGVGATFSPLAAADLDGDGRLEVIVGSQNGTVYVLEWNLTKRWEFTPPGPSNPIDYFSTAADVDGDGAMEVLFMRSGNTDSKVYAMSADGLTQEWNTGIYPGRASWAPVSIADVDGDGIKDLFLGGRDTYLYAFYGNNGTVRWREPVPRNQWGYGTAVGNVSGSPAPEIVLQTAAGDVHVVTWDQMTVWTLAPVSGQSAVTPSLGDINGDGRLDIVGGTNMNNGDQWAVRGEDGSLIWARATSASQFGGQILVDFEDDGRIETVFAKTDDYAISVLNDDGTFRWNYTTLGSIYGVPAAADVTGDGVEEILIGSYDGYLHIVNSTGDPVAVLPAPDQVSATPIVADLDGDGTMEVVFSSRTRTYAYETGVLGHDFRTGGYNYAFTGLFLDGNSPDGAPLLQTSLGPVENLGGSGVTWRTRDGASVWASQGADYDGTFAASATAPGVAQWLAWNVTPIVQAWVRGQQPNVGLLLKVPTETSSSLVSLVSREGDATLRPALIVQYTDATVPSISPRVPNQVANEDGPLWTLDLQAFAQDPDTPLSRLRWDLAGVNASLYDFSGGNVTGNHRLYFQPRPDAFGNDLTTLFLFDDTGNSASQPLWVNITPVNDAPYWDRPPTTLYVKYGTPYTFDFDPYIKDVDTPRAQLALRADDIVHTTVAGFRVTFTYPANYPDAWDFVILTVDDGLLTSSESIAIRLTTDTPPELRIPLPDVTLNEGVPRTGVFDLDDYFYDPDQDVLYFSYGARYVTVTIIEGTTQPRNHQVDMRSLGEWWGVESVTFQARDPTGAIIEDTILVTVIPLNDPPVIEWIPPFVVRYDTPYVFDLGPHISDPDNDISQLTITTLIPPSITANITVAGTVLRMVFPQVNGALTAPYSLPLTIYVSDGIDTTFLPTSVSVTADYPPQLRNGTQIPDVTFFEDTALLDYLDLDTYFIDTDSSTIFYFSGPTDVQVSIDATNHSVDFAARQDWFGVELVTFRATDDQGAYAEDTIKVTVRPVNDAPYFEGLTPVTSREKNFFVSVRDFLRDVDNAVSELEVSTTESYVSVQGFLLIFNYPDGITQDSVNITVSDGLASTEATLDIVIEGPNLLLTWLPWILAVAAAAAVFVATRVLRSIVEEVFLIYRSGVPLVHLSRTLTSDKDPDLIASMFTAIQSFMNQSFQSMGVGALKGIELADHNVAVARGAHVILVVLYRGRESGRLERKVNEVVKDVEKEYGKVLEDWNGDVDRLTGVKRLLEHMWGAKESKGFLGFSRHAEEEEPPTPRT